MPALPSGGARDGREPGLLPVHEVEREPAGAAHAWRATGADPHFLLAGPFPVGWAILSLEARAERPSMATLYLDLGKGFTAETAYPLGRVGAEPVELSRPLWLPSDVRGVRLDPASAPGPFTMEHVALTAVSDEEGLEAALAMLDEWLPLAGERVGELARAARDARAGGDLPRLVAALAEAIPVLDAVRSRPYVNWLRHRARSPEACRAEAAELVASWADAPLISVLMPVHDPPEAFLDAAIRSVRAQAYPRWELCVVDDASSRPHVAALLDRHRAEEPRIRVERLTRNGGISAASNRALEMAGGTFLALLDHDDLLSEDALLAMAAAIRANPDAGMFYSDEDKVDASGVRMDPFFKPDWSPEYFLACMYTCHLGVYRADLMRAIGGFRSAFDGAQDYDLVLRLTRGGTRVVHVPRVLYTWRMHGASTAMSAESKPYAHFAAERTILERLGADGADAWLETSPTPGFHSVRHRLRGEPLVSVLLLREDGGRGAADRSPDATSHALARLVGRTGYRPLEVLLVDASAGPRPGLVLPPEARWASSRGATLAERLSQAAGEARGALLLLLHEDVEPCDPSWLLRLAEYAQRDEIGAAGPKLLLPSGRIDQAGSVLCAGSVEPAFRGAPPEHRGYFLSALVPRNFSVLPGACLLLRRALFLETGGLDAAVGPLATADLCLKLGRRGLRLLLVPRAEVYHRAAAALDAAEPTEVEQELFRSRWGDALARDPFYNPNFEQHAASFELQV